MLYGTNLPLNVMLKMLAPTGWNLALMGIAGATVCLVIDFTFGLAVNQPHPTPRGHQWPTDHAA